MPRARHRRSCDTLGVGRDDHLAVPLAVWEAASNVVDHAYIGREPGWRRCTAELDGRGVLEVTVVDDGRWRERRSDPGGRGSASSARSPITWRSTPRGRNHHPLRRTLSHPAVIGHATETVEPVATRTLDIAVVRRDPTVPRPRLASATSRWCRAAPQLINRSLPC